jgi:dCMP deaminase
MPVPANKMIRANQKLEVFKQILLQISTLSTSSRLKVSCILVKKDFTKIASFGYNGNYFNAPINEETMTEEESLESGKDGFIHAEINAIAKFREHDPQNYIVMISHSPCANCAKVLANSGFKYIYWLEEYRETSHIDSIFTRSKIMHGNWNELLFDYTEGEILQVI